MAQRADVGRLKGFRRAAKNFAHNTLSFSSPPNPLFSRLLLSTTNAQQSSTNPAPPLNGDYLISTSPILTPWANGASAVAGSSNTLGNSVARVTFGACTYLVSHSHAFAWEVLTPVTAGRSVALFFLPLFSPKAAPCAPAAARCERPPPALTPPKPPRAFHVTRSPEVSAIPPHLIQRTRQARATKVTPALGQTDAASHP